VAPLKPGWFSIEQNNIGCQTAIGFALTHIIMRKNTTILKGIMAIKPHIQDYFTRHAYSNLLTMNWLK